MKGDVKKMHLLKVGGRNLNIENWLVFHPNGKHMFTCGEKRMKWYINKGLAEIIDKNKIKLNFIPKGDGFEDNEHFGRNERIVQCVVSGINNNLQRHHIIPYCYRSYFPEEFKSRNHHDVVLINYHIHSKYESKASQFKDDIAKLFNVKTIKECNYQYCIKLRKIKSKHDAIISEISSILKNYDLPKNKLVGKLNNIAKNLNINNEIVENYNYIQLLKLLQLIQKDKIRLIDEFNQKHRLEYDHGYLVVSKLNTEDKIEEFVKLWRKHFIETTNPKYMPDGWSLDFRIKTRI
jgi:hypothetical protein